jgi:hypothetical protein
MRLILALCLLALPFAKAEDSNAEKELEQLSKEVSDFQGKAAEAAKQIEQLGEKLAASPSKNDPGDPLFEARKKVMKLAGDDRFLQSAKSLWDHPERDKVLLIQLGFFLLMIVLKAWRQAKASHWLKKLLLGFLFSLLTWVGVLYVIPLAVLGEPFGVFTGTLFRVLLFGGP